MLLYHETEGVLQREALTVHEDGQTREEAGANGKVKLQTMVTAMLWRTIEELLQFHVYD